MHVALLVVMPTGTSPSTIPVASNDVPVAAPITGVISVGVFAKTTAPVPVGEASVMAESVIVQVVLDTSQAIK